MVLISWLWNVIIECYLNKFQRRLVKSLTLRIRKIKKSRFHKMDKLRRDWVEMNLIYYPMHSLGSILVLANNECLNDE